MLHKTPIGGGYSPSADSTPKQGSPSMLNLRGSQSFRNDGSSGFLSARSESHAQQTDLNIGTSAFAEALVTQLFHNLALLRVKVLDGADVPLSSKEVSIIENGRETDKSRLSSLEEILRLMRDQMASKRKLLATAAISTRSMRLVSSSQSMVLDEDDDPLEKPSDPQEVIRRVVAEHVNTCFSFTMEELALRLAAHHESERSRVAPRARLDKAIAYQTEQLTKASVKANATNSAMAVLRKKVEELEGTLQRREDRHKKQLDGFLREVCILKEQLYRSYRDKDYIAKDIDLMETVEDVDTGEDVSVDSLLQYRRQVRVADKLVMEAQAKLRRLEEEMAEKEQQVSRELHRQRSKDIGANAMRVEMGELNTRCLQQEETIRTLQHALSVARGDYEPPTFADMDTQTKSDEEEAIENITLKTNKASAARNHTRLELLHLIDATAQEKEALLSEMGNVTATMEQRNKESLKAFEEKISTLEDERDKAFFERDEVIANSKDAIEISRKAKEEVDSIRSLAISQAQSLIGELVQAQRTSDSLRVKSLAVCRAYLGLQVRLEAMKTRQGVGDYKRKANAFHFQRAQTAVDCAKEEIATVRKQCTSQLELAAQMIRDAKSAEAKMRSELHTQEEEHKAGVDAIQDRVSTMEKASRILLQDYERLRNEFAARSSKASPLQSRVGSANGSNMRRPASGKTAAPLPPLLPEQAEAAAAPEVAEMHSSFDALIKSGNTEANAAGAAGPVGDAERVIRSLVLDLVQVVGGGQAALSSKSQLSTSSSAALKEAESWARLRKLLSTHSRLQNALSEITTISRKAAPK